jgi:hypothetical protein
MPSLLVEGPAEPDLLDDDELALVQRALAAIEKVDPGDARMLRGHLNRLGAISGLIQAVPTLYATEVFAGRQRSFETLVKHLCHTDGLAGDLALPLKATLSRTFLVAKIQFFRGFVRAANVKVGLCEGFEELDNALRFELSQSMYTQLAEELLLALLRKPDVLETTKRRAANQLVAIWENAEIEIDDFCPLLESAWRARNHVDADLGSLLGTIEYFRLVAEDCAPQFLDFFNRDEVSLQERQAFEEFLFDMTFEELSTLRSEMRLQQITSITRAWAEEVLGRRLDHETVQTRIDPLALCRSYYRRQLAADFRIVAGRPGPRRTAEAYMMIYLLEGQTTGKIRIG